MRHLKEYCLFEQNVFSDKAFNDPIEFKEMKGLCTHILSRYVTEPELFQEDHPRWNKLLHYEKASEIIQDPLLKSFVNSDSQQKEFDHLVARLTYTVGGGQIIGGNGSEYWIHKEFGDNVFCVKILYFMINNEVPKDWDPEFKEVEI